MATVRETIAGALRLIGVKGSGQTLTSTEDGELLVLFNDLLEEWANEGLLVPSRTSETFTWGSGNASRTIGSSGNFATVRPIRIESAFIRENDVDYPLTLLSDKEYQEIADKTTTATIPTKLYHQGTATNATLYIWPVPSASVTIGLSSLKPFAAVAIGDTLAYPPGYNKAIKFNLAPELAAEYGMSVPLWVLQKAEETKEALRRTNLVVPKLRFESGLPGLESTFNVYTGEE